MVLGLCCHTLKQLVAKRCLGVLKVLNLKGEVNYIYL